ncbi:MAG: FHA domain-containing protein [Planctomycetota bacterium]|nr:FHA domain-containing protein [Planctomycetota bacterium]
MATLRIEVKGQTFEAPLPDQAVRIGSADDADLKLNVGAIGGTHCVLEPLGNDRYRLRDSGSGYQTKVNGNVIKQISLSAGDVIEVGDARITFIPDAAVKTPPAKPKPVTPAVAPKAAPASVAPPASREAKAKGPARPEPRPKAATNGGTNGGTNGSARREGEARRRARGSRSRLIAPLIGVALAAAAAIVVMNQQSEKASQSGALKNKYEAAVRLLDAKDWSGAKAGFEALVQQNEDTAVQDKAKRRLAHIRSRDAALEADLAELVDQALDYRPSDLAARRDYFLQEYGAQWLPRFESLTGTITALQSNWLENTGAALTFEAGELIKAGRFDEALENWRRLKRSAPLAVDVDDLIAQGVHAVESKASVAADRLTSRVARLDKRSGPDMAARWLEKRMAGFAGTKAEVKLAGTLRGLREAAEAAAAAAAAAQPATPTPSQPTPAAEGPSAPATPTTPAAVIAAKQALDLAAAMVKERRFDTALSTITGAHAEAPAGEWKGTLASRRDDLDMAKKAFEALVADIKANGKDKFRRVPLSDRLKATLVDADFETIATLVRGGESRFRWERVSPRLFAELFERSEPTGEAAVNAAALMQVVGGPEAASQLAFQAGQSGVDTGRLFALIARWRGEDVPAGGYVVHEGAYVTPARRDFLVLEARIADAMQRITSPKLDVREGAYKELLAIGEPARDRFEASMRVRRDAVIEEIAENKAFRSSKHKSKLLGLLKTRRATALKLIFDSQAYPYPNPNKRNQKEVEELVDLVREVWDRPFDLIAQWDKNLKAELERVTEVDAVLAQIDPGYSPDLDVVKERINKAIDMPSYAPGGKEASNREYSLKVLSFNERLETTATEQEKDNTRAVNEYRMMMGLRAVKINERLLRGARGHSRHMRQNNYFAHNVPANKGATNENRTPGNRAKQQGYGGGVGENIAMGPGTGRGAFWAWFRSSGHHRNMLSRWTEMGCGRTGSYWTQLFGGASGFSLSTPDPLPAPTPHFAPEAETSRRGRARLPDSSDDDGLFKED